MNLKSSAKKILPYHLRLSLRNLEGRIEKAGKETREKLGRKKEQIQNKIPDSRDGEKTSRKKEGEERRTPEKIDNSTVRRFRDEIEFAMEKADSGAIKQAQKMYNDLVGEFRGLKARNLVGKKEHQLLEELHSKVNKSR